MAILSLNFFLFRCIGLSVSEEVEKKRKYLMSCCTVITVMLVYYFTVTEVIDLIFMEHNVDRLTNNLSLLLTTIPTCHKMTNVLARRRRIQTMMDMLNDEVCQLRNKEEMAIQKRYDHMARVYTKCFMILTQSTIIAFSMVPTMMRGWTERILPFESWLPYKVSNIFLYWITYAQRSLTIIIGGTINVASDTLVSGLIMQACSQLDILNHRLVNIARAPNSRASNFEDPYVDDAKAEKSIRRCIPHHIWIYKFTAMIEEVFGPVVFVQVFVGVLTLGSSIFQLSQKSATIGQAVSYVLYLGCMLTGLLLYCWYGNNLKLKSQSTCDALYESSWTRLHPRTRKYLIVMMARTGIPRSITCCSILELSLQTYTSVLKTSYSSFNLLRNF